LYTLQRQLRTLAAPSSSLSHPTCPSPAPQVQQFWADKRELALGAVFRQRSPAQPEASLKRPLSGAEFDAGVEQGFQATATWHQGSLVRQEAGASGKLPSTVDTCRWAFSVRQVEGWGDVGTAWPRAGSSGAASTTSLWMRRTMW
jgi:tocopherol cyclase